MARFGSQTMSYFWSWVEGLGLKKYAQPAHYLDVIEFVQRLGSGLPIYYYSIKCFLERNFPFGC